MNFVSFIKMYTMNLIKRRDLAEYSSQELVDIAFSRKDPEASKALYMLTSYKEPLYVKAWQLQSNEIGYAIDDLVDVMQWLRDEKSFAQADRIRTIAGRLARARRPDVLGKEKNTFREMAKDWPNQLTPKESNKIIQESSILKTEILQLKEALQYEQKKNKELSKKLEESKTEENLPE